MSGELRLENNALLTSLNGLDNIDPTSINALYLQNSDLLAGCAVPSICGFLEINNGPAVISGNASGCNSRSEVESDCTFLTVDDIVKENIKLYPNPTTDIFTISDPYGAVIKYEIFSSTGRLILSVENSLNNISISSYPSGLYFIKLYDKSGFLITTEKLVIR